MKTINDKPENMVILDYISKLHIPPEHRITREEYEKIMELLRGLLAEKPKTPEIAITVYRDEETGKFHSAITHIEGETFGRVYALKNTDTEFISGDKKESIKENTYRTMHELLHNILFQVSDCILNEYSKKAIVNLFIDVLLEAETIEIDQSKYRWDIVIPLYIGASEYELIKKHVAKIIEKRKSTTESKQ